MLLQYSCTGFITCIFALISADLTFELAMKERPPTAEPHQSMKLFNSLLYNKGLPTESRQDLQRLKEQLNSANAEIMQLRSSVSMKEESASLLQHQLKEMEQKYQNQLTSKETLVQKLQSELDSQSSLIAYLTMKLHQSKQKYRKAMEQLKTLYNSGYMVHTSDSFLEDDIKKLERNVTRSQTPPPSQTLPFSITGTPRGSNSEPSARSKIDGRELSQVFPISPHPPSTPRNASTPSSSKVRRSLLRRSNSHTMSSPNETTTTTVLSSSGELSSSVDSATSGPIPAHCHLLDVSDILEPSALAIDKLKLGSSHPVLPPIQDSLQEGSKEGDSLHKLVKSQLPPDTFVGIRKIKKLSSARQLAANEVPTTESSILVKDDTSWKTQTQQ